MDEAKVNLLAASGGELTWRGHLWERLRRKDFWPAALLHGTLNGVAGLSLVLVERTHDFLVGVVGLPGLFLLALFNLWLRRQV
nr:CPBP family glutamic-type intramembrane protease [Thermus sediminis]